MRIKSHKKSKEAADKVKLKAPEAKRATKN